MEDRGVSKTRKLAATPDPNEVTNPLRERPKLDGKEPFFPVIVTGKLIACWGQIAWQVRH
jgi:hypothetical protein